MDAQLSSARPASPPPIRPEAARRVLILACSYKCGGWCIAGKLADGPDAGQWVRPVGNAASAGLPDAYVRAATGGHLVGPLDCVDVPLGAPASFAHQPENRNLLPGPWSIVGRATAQTITALADQPPTLWGPGRGLNPVAARTMASSLLLVRVRHLELYWRPSERGLKLRACFAYGGVGYDLPVTDPKTQARCAGEMLTEHADALLTLSLAMPLNDVCYKLVAAVMPLDAP